VRKIFSIIVALGLVLGLVMMAAPTAAQVCEEEVMAEVSVDPPCACADAAYNITFNTSASLTEGFNHVCVKFPAGTTIPAEFDDDVILISVNGGTDYGVFGSEVTVTGTQVCFIVPVNFIAGEILVQFTLGAGIENPCTADDYTLTIWTDRAPDSTPLPGEYTIIPAYSTYKYVFDFGLTYPGVAKGFVPPFRACGQNDTGKQYDTTYVPEFGGFVSNFTLFFQPNVEGCYPPCSTVDLWLEIVNIPAGETMHLILDGQTYNLTVCNITANEGKFDTSTDIMLEHNYALAANTTLNWTGALHFSSPGKDYKIGLYYTCPKTTCNPGGTIGGTQVFKVYQDKEAYKLTLCEKWNLVSLPLVPLVDPPTVEEYLASIAIFNSGALGHAVIGAIWYYDAFAPAATAWKHWAPGDPTNNLLELSDGKAYWVYVAYPLGQVIATLTDGAIPASLVSCCGQLTWWIWGTEKPVPPAAPSQYAVNTGWNMVGFTSTNTTMHPSDYLWNWISAPTPVVYAYSDGCWNVQTWDLINFTSGLLVPGEGYWMAFPKAGNIYVP
jgi:hypothetical protein